ncbi:MAG: PilZ domain-containing protein [Desulfuromonadales bacterium]
MSYGRYFPTGQKTFLKRVFAEGEQIALDTITGYVTGTGANHVDFSLPYGSDAANDYPFEPGMRFELLCDNKGMGLRLQASFQERRSSCDIRLQFEGNLEFISRRQYRRVDVTAWVGVKRGSGHLSEMRKAWEENLQQLQAGVSAAKLTEFQKYPINLAGGGLRLPVKAPVKIAELFLVFLSIGDKGGIICAMAEVIWAGSAESDGTQPAGLRFLNILENDQVRIDKVVNGLLKRLEQAGS